MVLSCVHLHMDCPTIAQTPEEAAEGKRTAPPKFELVAHSEDGLRLLFRCSGCGDAAQLTLVTHTSDNPPEGFPVLAEEIADAPERPSQSADA